MSGGLKEILKYPVEEVFYIELDPAIVELARAYIPEEDEEALKDGRRFIRYKGKGLMPSS